MLTANDNSVAIYYRVDKDYQMFTYVQAQYFDYEIVKLERTFANQAVAMDGFNFYVWVPK